MHPTLDERQQALSAILPLATTPYLHAFASQEARAIARERDALVCSCLNLVRHLAGLVRKNRRDICHEELISAGNYGLVRAADYYRPGLKAKFSTYAATSIYRAMSAHVDFLTSIISVPRESSRPRRFDPFAQQASRTVPIPERCHELAVESCPLPGQDVREDRAERWLSTLTERTRYVVRRVVFDRQPYTVISGEVGVSKERVRQIYQQGLELLREKLAGVAC